MKLGEHMHRMTLKKLANFYGDRPIISAITLQKVLKNYISVINNLFLSDARLLA